MWAFRLSVCYPRLWSEFNQCLCYRSIECHRILNRIVNWLPVGPYPLIQHTWTTPRDTQALCPLRNIRCIFNITLTPCKCLIHTGVSSYCTKLRLYASACFGCGLQPSSGSHSRVSYYNFSLNGKG